MKKLEICFIMESDPEFLGGLSVYQRNILSYFNRSKKGLNINITCIYPGKTRRTFILDKVTFIELPAPGPFPLKYFPYARQVNKFLKNRRFDVINSHAMAGYYLNKFKNKNTITIHTYHGVAYYFYKCHLESRNFFKKFGALALMLLGYFLEKPPVCRADKVVCVSQRVDKELTKLYGKSSFRKIIRSGVDLGRFGKLTKRRAREILKIEQDKKYLLYVGRGGPWRKGLDRAVSLANNIMALDNSYRTIIIGPEKTKENLKILKNLNSAKVIYLTKADRERIPKYYAAADIFFCFSRYEGGAPILTLSEAMASSCLPVCSKDSEQEVISNGKNGLIISQFDCEDAKKVLETYKNLNLQRKLRRNALNTAKNLSLDKWGKEYWEVILK